jgi:hypothetical protein
MENFQKTHTSKENVINNNNGNDQEKSFDINAMLDALKSGKINIDDLQRIDDTLKENKKEIKKKARERANKKFLDKLISLLDAETLEFLPNDFTFARNDANEFKFYARKSKSDVKKPTSIIATDKNNQLIEFGTLNDMWIKRYFEPNNIELSSQTPIEYIRKNIEGISTTNVIDNKLSSDTKSKFLDLLNLNGLEITYSDESVLTYPSETE